MADASEIASNKETLKEVADASKASPKDDSKGPAEDDSKGEKGKGKGSKTNPSPTPNRATKYAKHKYHKQMRDKGVSVAEADRLILLAMGGSLAVVAIAHFAGDKTLDEPSEVFRSVGGTIVAGVGLLIFAEFEPDLAKIFALLFLASTLLSHSDGFTKGLNRAVKPTMPKDIGSGIGGKNSIPPNIGGGIKGTTN